MQINSYNRPMQLYKKPKQNKPRFTGESQDDNGGGFVPAAFSLGGTRCRSIL